MKFKAAHFLIFLMLNLFVFNELVYTISKKQNIDSECLETEESGESENSDPCGDRSFSFFQDPTEFQFNDLKVGFGKTYFHYSEKFATAVLILPETPPPDTI